jgi:hypothetical protein
MRGGDGGNCFVTGKRGAATCKATGSGREGEIVCERGMVREAGIVREGGIGGDAEIVCKTGNCLLGGDSVSG